ncbi:hypothetical protein LTR94_025397 [Friedmanniomyces endolithicus]|nr:hypothetical protein LTR94_025397 [Friedmanniomyces endolithicus]
MSRVETFRLGPLGWVPNNQNLAVAIYSEVEASDGASKARAFERRFGEHGRPAQWRDTVFDYVHYHSTALEVLGVAVGRADLMIGGEGGRRVTLSEEDALLLPAGTGHCLIRSSRDFEVIGAYPEGQDWDLCRSAPTADALERIRNLLAPRFDPVTGDALVQTEADQLAGKRR